MIPQEAKRLLPLPPHRTTDRAGFTIEEDPVAVGTRVGREEEGTPIRSQRHLIPLAAVLVLVLACTDPRPAGDKTQRGAFIYCKSARV